MRPALRIGLLAAALIGCFPARLPAVKYAHPCTCTKKISRYENSCNCIQTGYPPEEKRVETNQREEILIDWRLQDGMKDGLDPGKIRRVVYSLGDDAGKLRADCDVLARAKVPAKDGRWLALYRSACEKRRELRLKPYREALRRVLFAKHFDMGGSHYAYTESCSDAIHESHFVPGSQLCLLEMDAGVYPKCRVLLDDPTGVIRDPDVSFDARRILFAWKKSYRNDDYHLYEMEIESKKTRQLTTGRFADYECAYMPDGHIVFSSTRCIQTVDCWWVEVSNLFTCDGDGKYIRRLGFDQVHTNYPTLTDDGRLVYTRWDYNDRGQMAIQSLFQMNPDGTAQRELYGNNSHFPTSILHTRAIPGTGKYACILSGHHARQRGYLAVIDPRKGRQENQGVQLIAPLRETPPEVKDRYGRSGDIYMHPYPLGENAFLVGLNREAMRNTDEFWQTERFSLYFVTTDGKRELLYKDNNISCTQAMPIRPRSATKRANLADYRRDTGTVYLHDIYIGPGLHQNARELPAVKRGDIKRLRVVGLEFRPCSAKGAGTGCEPFKREGPAMGYKNRGPISAAAISTGISIAGGAWDVKKVLGTATVYEDGSACFTVPARVPIFFQALDARGQMVQSMRSWMTLQPGETISCIGCHERKNIAPPVPYTSRALAAGAETLDRRPFDGEPQGFDFLREIQPMLDRHCVRCHHLDKDALADDKKKKKKKDKQSSFSLKWPESYHALANRKVCNWINAQSKPPMLPPYYTGAVHSRLIKMLEGENGRYYSPPEFGKLIGEGTWTKVTGGLHYNTKLSQPEMQKLIAWIDLGVPCYGDYPFSQENYYLKKKRDWEAKEAENIRHYLARPH